MSVQKPHRLIMALLPLLVTLSGCGSTTIYLDKLEAANPGQPPAVPTTGTSSSNSLARIDVNPQNAASPDRWLRLSRTSPTAQGGEYIGTFTQNVTQKKAGVNLVGLIPASSKVMMTVYFEPAPPFSAANLLHIDLHPNGEIHVNDSTDVAGTFKFDTLVGIFIGFDLSSASPSASILVRGGANDANLTVQIPSNVAIRGLGRVRILAPFEGVNAPNGSFLVNDVLATTPQ